MIAFVMQKVSGSNDLSGFGAHRQTNIHGIVIWLKIGGNIGDAIDGDFTRCEAFVPQSH